MCLLPLTPPHCPFAAPAVRTILEQKRTASISAGYWSNSTIQVNFQNKTLYVSASTKMTKKRQIQALLPIIQLGALLVVFITHTFNCCCKWLYNYCGNSLVSWLQLSGSAAPWRTQNAAGRGCRTTGQHRIRAVLQRTCIQWNSRVTIYFKFPQHQ